MLTSKVLDAIRSLSDCHSQIEQYKLDTFFVLIRVMSFLMAEGEHYARQQGITLGHLRIIMLLDHNAGHGLSPFELASMNSVTLTTMKELLDSLEQENLINRTSNHSNEESFFIHLTPKGSTFLHSILPDLFTHIEKIMTNLCNGECKDFNRLLSKIEKGIQYSAIL
jgi:DNA-binding MarR family transcriptional regulator